MVLHKHSIFYLIKISPQPNKCCHLKYNIWWSICGNNVYQVSKLRRGCEKWWKEAIVIAFPAKDSSWYLFLKLEKTYTKSKCCPYLVPVCEICFLEVFADILLRGKCVHALSGSTAPIRLGGGRFLISCSKSCLRQVLGEWSWRVVRESFTKAIKSTRTRKRKFKFLTSRICLWSLSRNEGGVWARISGWINSRKCQPFWYLEEL